MYNDPDCKPWTSRSWAPTGYSSRYDLIQQAKAARAGRKPFADRASEEQLEMVDSNEKGGVGVGVVTDVARAQGYNSGTTGIGVTAGTGVTNNKVNGNGRIPAPKVRG